MTDSNPALTSRMPDTYLILIGVALLAFAMTYLITPGSFGLVEQVQSNGEVRQLLDPDSFTPAPDGPQGLPLFAEGGKIGLLNLPFEGLVSGDKWGAAIGVFAFILITGGAFGVILATGAVHRGLLALIHRSRSLDILAVPVLFVAFSLGGAVFGMGEEVIPFVLIVVPVFLVMGYDSLTALLVTYVATQIGFACSWMNPFSVSVAQGIAQLPLMSGLGFRATLWVLFTALGTGFAVVYALRVKRDPQRSLTYHCDQQVKREKASASHTGLTVADWGVLLTLFSGIAWMVWGVTQRGYYLPEIASQFFTMGVVAAVIGCCGRLDGMTANGAVEAFRHGAAQLLPAALVVAFAKGIVLVLGGAGPGQPSVLNTLLHHASQSLSGLPEMVAACAMFLFQSVFNFFVTSGSGQAALTMPIMAPLSDLIGVSRQVAVLAFQLGDGFTNIIVPTSAALMGCLGAARVDWGVWIRFMAWPIAAIFLLSCAVMAVAVVIQF
ncbi:putative basic amino acid antiporter YfcC [Pseudomaricurvus alkylphenolicus]|uniref:putative basic amino acid antiporter YfcC n=1 Tax=Pseudomaricurvus alkylphenolicus TaxID=1306991 RepID=UPI00141EB946|nr:putative basic amino acid antiporter YfcC [Pseudomaricurvus alkylphenolicus]NIB41068.1 putative basic amino acid antiporter YfcC [Pseudomaricurvus alkylphenolicus]